MEPRYSTVELFDLDFISATHHTEVIEDVIAYQHTPNYLQKLPFVITPNADQIVKLDQLEYQTLKGKLSQALFIFPDGQPIVWFSQLVHKPLKARLTGSDLFSLLWQRIKTHQYRVLVVVSNETLGDKLTQDYTNALCYTPPFFDLDSQLFNQVCQDLVHHIKDFKPNYVVVGIGFPKQEWLSLAIQKKLTEMNITSPLFLCLGASAEFYVGMKKRAPRLLQKIGLEWLHRLWLEPKRMWRRYILGSISLLGLFIKEFKKQVFHSRHSN
jgi:N-acetylglucosaminyldiphosphoundecaprenol N-acetyl-beta-D-mannosaminyltransferase